VEVERSRTGPGPDHGLAVEVDPVPPLYHQQLAYPFVGSTERLAQPARLAEASPTPAGKSE